MFRKLYLAYGSNLNKEYMKRRCPNAKPFGTTIIYNYRLVFKGNAEGCSFLTIEPHEGSYVPVGIYSISLSDEKKLDFYEGYPKFYKKDSIILKINGKSIYGFLYVMNNDISYNLPSNDYYSCVLTGYRNYGFNPNLLKKAIIDTNLAKGTKSKK